MYGESGFNKLVGKLRGAKILYQNNGVYVLKVTDFEACNKLFARESIDWCIANNEYHWDDYVKNPGNKQYFIVDFNLMNSDSSYEANQAFIGFTLTKDGKLYAAHGRNDKNLLRKEFDGEMIFDKWLKHKGKGVYNFVVESDMEKANTDEKTDYSMVPVYFLVGSILAAMMTLFIRCS